MQVAEIMKTKVVSVSMDDPLSLLHELFDKAAIHHLPVLDDRDRLVGMVSDRDYLEAISPYAGTPGEMKRDKVIELRPAHRIMSRDPLHVTPDTDVREVVELMLEHVVSAMPIVEDNELKGIVSWKDLLRHYAET